MITLELAARFAADTLNESYFAWDPTQFKNRSTHNLVRASAQLKLAQSYQQQKKAAQTIIEKLTNG
jgi:hypothetical protein